MTARFECVLGDSLGFTKITQMQSLVLGQILRSLECFRTFRTLECLEGDMDLHVRDNMVTFRAIKIATIPLAVQT